MLISCLVMFCIQLDVRLIIFLYVICHFINVCGTYLYLSTPSIYCNFQALVHFDILIGSWLMSDWCNVRIAQIKELSFICYITLKEVWCKSCFLFSLVCFYGLLLLLCLCFSFCLVVRVISLIYHKHHNYDNY